MFTLTTPLQMRKHQEMGNASKCIQVPGTKTQTHFMGGWLPLTLRCVSNYLRPWHVTTGTQAPWSEEFASHFSRFQSLGNSGPTDVGRHGPSWSALSSDATRWNWIPLIYAPKKLDSDDHLLSSIYHVYIKQLIIYDYDYMIAYNA